MRSFRKHANADTQCPDSRSGRRPDEAVRAPLIAALLGVLLSAVLGAAGTQARAQAAAGSSESAPAAQSGVASKASAADESGGEVAVPIRFHFAGTRQRPLVVATIGDFPKDLGEAGKEFLQREFFEHFINDTLKLGALESSEALKVTLLPRTSGNEQQCSFSLDGLEGHMSVVVLERRVLVVCSFRLSGAKSPVNLAAARLAAAVQAG
jgi:hypothetical protein